MPAGSTKKPYIPGAECLGYTVSVLRYTQDLPTAAGLEGRRAHGPYASGAGWFCWFFFISSCPLGVWLYAR